MHGKHNALSFTILLEEDGLQNLHHKVHGGEVVIMHYYDVFIRLFEQDFLFLFGFVLSFSHCVKVSFEFVLLWFEVRRSGNPTGAASLGFTFFCAFNVQRYGKVFIYPQNCHIFFVRPSFTAWQSHFCSVFPSAV